MDHVTDIAFSPDSATVATASDDGTVRLWDTSTGAAAATLTAMEDGGHATVFSDGRYQVADHGGSIWWAIKLCRFAASELDPCLPVP